MSVLCVGHHPEHPAEPAVGRLCEACYRRLGSQLMLLPAVDGWLHLNVAAAGSAWAGEQRVSGSREAPTPLRMDVLDLIGPTNGDRIADSEAEDWLGISDTGSILDTVMSWCVSITDDRQIDPPAKTDLTSLCRWLHRQTAWIAGQDWVDEFLTQLHQLHRNASRVAPWREELLRDRQEPCGDCGVLALVQHVGDGRVVCEERLGGCGRGRAVTAYEWNTRHLRTRPKQAEAS